MTSDYRQRPGAPWDPRQVPTLQPGDQKLVVSEHFDRQTGPQILAGFLPNAIPWTSPPWRLWDLRPVAPLQYVDAVRKAGVMLINDDGFPGDQSVAAMLHPFPAPDPVRFPAGQQWVAYSRVGMLANAPALMADVGKWTWGVLLSSVDLIDGGPGPIDGAFLLAGLVLTGGSPFAIGASTDWLGFSAVNSVNPSEVFGNMLQMFVRLRMAFTPGEPGSTFVVVDFSPDGEGWLCNLAAYTLAGPPKWIGLGGTVQQNAVASGFAPRMDYLDVFEGSTEPGFDTIHLLQTQGGQQYY